MESRKPDDQWVSSQLNELAPSWETDVPRATSQLHVALGQPTRRSNWVVASGVAALMCMAVALTPQARGLAQATWAKWTMTGGVDVVFDSGNGWSVPGNISMSGAESVHTLAEAERIGAFSLQLPEPISLGGAPAFTVMGPIEIEQTLDVGMLSAALERVGAKDVAVPHAWHGAVVGARIRSLVIATYSGGVQIAQALKPELYVPVGIALNDLAVVIFRGMGMPDREATAAGLAYSMNPTWLLAVPTEERRHVHRVALRNGEALVIEEADASGGVKEVTVLRSNSDRIFAVTTPNRQTSLAVAEALP